MKKTPERPPYIVEGEILYPVTEKPPKEAIREMHVFTQAYFDQFPPASEEEHQKWLSMISGVTH